MESGDDSKECGVKHVPVVVDAGGIYIEDPDGFAWFDG